jgi:hypothetical protein
MRRSLTILACLGVLAFAGASTALARGPHHSPPPRRAVYSYGYGAYRAPWNAGYRGGYGSYCGRPRTVAYPVYPAYAGPVYGPAYPQVGFGVAGRNFSFWLQQ